MKSITLNLVVLVYTSKTGGIMPILTLMNPTPPPPPQLLVPPLIK